MLKKNIIITGGTKGMGRAIAFLFAAQGFDIAICSRNINDLKATSDELKATYGINCIWLKTDLNVKEEVKAFGDFILSHWSHCDILVNNAGFFKPATILEEDDSHFEQMMHINFSAAYYLTKKIAPVMVKAKTGHIFNISSIASISEIPKSGSYAISKHAMSGFSRTLREDLKPFHVKVTTLYPGATLTNSWAGSDMTEERIIPADDIAKLIYAIYNTGPSTTVEEMVVRPTLGDV